MDYNQFQWEDGQNLRSSDEAPSMMFRTYKINMLIEQIDVTSGGALDAFLDMNSTVNKILYNFIHLSKYLLLKLYSHK